MRPLIKTAPSSRQERRRREVHDRILAAAVQRFDQSGVEATKIDEICAVADVAQKTFFNHFPSKQHLVREIAWSFHTDLVAILAEVQRTPGTTRVHVELFFQRIAREAQAAGAMRRELVMEVIRLNHQEGIDSEQRLLLQSAFEAMLRKGIRAGDIARAHPVATLAENLAGAFYVVMLNWLADTRYPIRQRAAAMARLLGDSFAATAPRPTTRAKKSTRQVGLTPIPSPSGKGRG